MKTFKSLGLESQNARKRCETKPFRTFKCPEIVEMLKTQGKQSISRPSAGPDLRTETMKSSIAVVPGLLKHNISIDFH